MLHGRPQPKCYLVRLVFSTKIQYALGAAIHVSAEQ